jgi:hypothetical protein
VPDRDPPTEEYRPGDEFDSDDDFRPADPFEETGQFEPIEYEHVRTRRKLRLGRVLVPLAVGLILGGIAGATVGGGDNASVKTTPKPSGAASPTPGLGHWVEGDDGSVTGRVAVGVNGAIVLQGAEIPTSVSCGDDVLLVWTTQTTFQPEGTVPESLANKRVQATGRLDRLKDGPCALVASQITVLGVASPTPSGSPKRTTSPSPARSSSPSATRTPGPTAAPTPTPEVTSEPTPMPTSTSIVP